MRTYYYHLVSAIRGDGKRTYHLYVTAKPRFSLRELLSKQINIIPAIIERLANIPFEIHTAAQMEIEKLNFNLTPVAGNYIRLRMDKSSILICHDRFLEFSSLDRDVILKILELLKERWRGKWIPGETETGGDKS